MKVFEIDRIWRPKRLGEIANRKVEPTTERAQGFPSKASQVQLCWKQTGNMTEIRGRAKADLRKGGCFELMLTRAELITMTSRLLKRMSIEELSAALEKAYEERTRD